MPDPPKPSVGSFAWRDLTVKDADGVREFYTAVVGWDYSEIDMDGYSDFSMLTPANGEVVAGICHARGVNQGLPPVWLVYIIVEDLDHSLATCRECGGFIVVEARELAGGRFAVIRDPAGAVCALYQAPS